MKSNRLVIILTLGLGLTLALLWLTGLPISRAAGPWYVAPGGSDSNTCTSPGAACATINGAIGKASPGDTIYVAIGTYTGAGDEVVLLDKNVTLSGGWDGNFAMQTGTSTIDGEGSRRGITANSGVTAVVERFTVQNGFITNNDGGGIYNDGSLTLNNSTVSGNAAGWGGGGIYNDGSLTLNNSAVSGNIAGLGGGIYNHGGTVTLNNSTVSGNTSTTHGGGIGNGFAGSAADLNLNSSTISGNAADFDGGGIFNGGNTVTLQNTILADNTASRTGPDCNGTIGSAGYNLIGDTSGCTFTPGTGDLTDVDANLGPLIGSPGYHPLLSDSLAINAGDIAGCTDDLGDPLDTDQRGAARVGRCDIGAYEYTIPGLAASIAAVGGTPQRTAPFFDFWMPFQAAVLDSIGSPVSNTLVTFSSPASGASGTFADSGTFTTTAATDEGGVATAATFTANGLGGSYTVTATVSGVITPVNFLLSNFGWYVAPGGDDANDCQTPATPCATVNGVLGKAGFLAGDTVLVASGTYTGTGDEVVLLDKSVRLLGGWNDTFSTQSGASTIDGEGARRGITVNSGATATVERFTVQNGYGGGIRNDGTLTLNNSTVSGNTGGGINNSGTLILNNSAVNGNTGGGIYNNGTLTLNNSTVSGNSADSRGGGIRNDGTLTLNNSTISNNMSIFSPGGGGIYNSSGIMTLQNSIIAGNTNSNGDGPDCRGTIGSLGYNLIGDTSGCGFTPTTDDLTNIDAQLGPLEGSPAYHPLLPGSPAIDAGNPAGCTDHLGNLLLTDQRGMPRVGRCDIGAYEFVGVYLTPLAQVGYDQAGSTVTYTVRLANRTGATDSFSLTIQPGNTWTTTLSLTQTDTLSNVGSLSFTVGVEIPPSASPGEMDSVTIQATSVTSPTVYSNTAAINTIAIGGDLAYVTLSDSDLVALVDTVSHIVVGSVDVGAVDCDFPWRATMSPDGVYVYVACYNSDNVAVIETVGNTVVTTVGGIPDADGIAFTRDGAYALVGSRWSNQVAVVDTAAYTVTNYIPTPDDARSVVVHPYLDTAYATSAEGTIQVIDTETFTITAAIPVGREPWDVAVSPNGWVFVSDRQGAGLAVIDAGNNTVHTTVTGLGGLTGLEVAPDGSKVYASGLENGIHVIDGATFNYITTIEGVGTAWEAAVTCDGSKLFVGNTGNQSPVIDTEIFSVTDQIVLPGSTARGIAICPQYVATGAFLIPSAQASYGEAGATVTYTVYLANQTGVITDDFNLTIQPGNTWTATLSLTQTGALADGDTLSFTVWTEIPSSASPGDGDSVTIQATSVTSPAAYSDTATIQTFAIGDLAYVTLFHSDLVALVDTANHIVLDSVDVGAVGCYFPRRAAMSPDGAYVYVACDNYYSGVVVIETADNTVVTTVGGIPFADGIAFTRDGAYALVGSSSLDQIAVVDTAAYTVTSYIPIPSYSYARSIAAHPYLDVAYATCDDGTIQVIDTETFTITAAIPVGKEPWDVAVSPDGWVFVSDRWGAGLAVIDAGNNAIHTTVAGLGGLAGLAVAPDGSMVYASGLWDGVHVIDGATFSHITTIGGVETAQDQEVAVTCDGSELYVGNTGDQVPVIDTGTFSVTGQIALPGYEVRGIALCPQYVATGAFLTPPAQASFGEPGSIVTYTLYLVNQTGATDNFDLAIQPSAAWTTTLSLPQTSALADGDTLSFTVWIEIPSSASPGDGDSVTIQVTSVASPTVYSDTTVINTAAIGGDRAYVTLSDSNLVALVDTASHIAVGSVDVGAAGCDFPWRATMSPDGAYVYVGCHSSGNVAVIETAGNTVAATVGGIPSADGIAFTRDGAYALVGSRWSNQVAVVDATLYTVMSFIPTPDDARSVAAHPNLNVAYATSAEGTIQVIDTTSFSVTAAIPVGSEPWDVAASSDGQWVFVSDRQGAGLAVIDTSSNTVYTTVTGLGDLTGLAVAPDGSMVYASGLENGVHVIDGATFSHITTIGGVGTAWEAAVTCDGSELYVGNTGSQAPVIDTGTFSVTGQIALPGYKARGIALCPQYAAAGAFLIQPTQAGSGEPGATITYTLRLANRTGAADSFNLAIQPGNTWTTTLSLAQTGVLSDGDSLAFTVWVEIPPSASYGSVDSVTIQAASVTSPGVYSDTAAINTTATGAELHVCTAGQPICDFDNVQAAVDVASDGGVIKVATGVYTDIHQRAGTTQVVYVNNTVTIRGGYTTTDWSTSNPISYPTTLDARGQGRVLYITGALSPTIEGLRITGGDAGQGGDDNHGGGVYVINAAATISDNQVLGNTASDGGGLYLFGSAATLSGNTVSANIASDGDGGGLYLRDSDTTLSSNTVSANTASDGGGLYLSGSAATLSGNTISGNAASGWMMSGSGGGLYLKWSAATLSGNTVSANTASDGGGLYLSGSAATLSGNTISGNTASSDWPLPGGGSGGGLYLWSYATLISNTITANTAGRGGGLYLRSSNPTLTNNIVADNQGNTAGSGLYIFEAWPRLLHTTIARNSGGDGSGVYLRAYTVALTNTILVSHTVGIYVESGSTARLEGTLWGSGAWANGIDWGGDGTVITGTVNLWGDPDFVNPDNGDYHISLGSAAVDAGVDAGVLDDIDGDPRTDGYPDIGADELGSALSVTKRAYPDPVQPGAQLTYTIRVTNTGAVDLHATVTDTLPAHVTTTQSLVWTSQLIPAPNGVWTEMVVVTVETGYVGLLTNTVKVTTEEGATGVYTEISTAVAGHSVYLPLVLRSFP